ncbi:hypothetical protein B0H14DRAFT_3884483 [Mycena olivaceomarginata]|nr:hypothetical protein B0H14DRAFT_3884483 [Mycena olivaceomarginata]
MDREKWQSIILSQYFLRSGGTRSAYVAVQMFNEDPTLVVMILQHNIIGAWRPRDIRPLANLYRAMSQMKAELATSVTKSVS